MNGKPLPFAFNSKLKTFFPLRPLRFNLSLINSKASFTRVAAERRREDANFGGGIARGLSGFQDFISLHAVDGFIQIVVRRNRPAFERCADERALAARVREYSGVERGVGRRRRSAPNRASRDAHLAAHLELILKQPVQS